MTPSSPCTCGHEHEAHEHQRRGTDCSRCDCWRFRGATGPRALLAALLGRR